MTDFDPRLMANAAAELIARTPDDHQRAIVENFRRHVLLELGGHWPRILEPDMTVEHPVYRFTQRGSTLVLDGFDEVAAFYRELSDSGLASLWGPLEIKLMVGDWGISAYGLLAQQLGGEALAAQGDEVDDLEAHYQVATYVSMTWLYDEDARLIGEHSFEDAGSRSIRKLDPSEVMTLDRANELLAPLVAEVLAATSPEG